MLIESKALIPHPLEYRLSLLVIKRHRDQRDQAAVQCRSSLMFMVRPTLVDRACTAASQVLQEAGA